MTDAESSIVVNRISMEDNIFTKPLLDRDRQGTSNSVHFTPLQPPQESTLTSVSFVVVLLSVIVQVVIGLFANSLALISDAARQFSDHLEQYKYDHTASPGQRIREVIFMAIPCVVTMILCVVFLVNASTRAANPDFPMNTIFLIIGAAIAACTNLLQVVVHIHTWKKHRSYSVMQFASNHRSQVLHGLINHGLAITVVIVAVLNTIGAQFRIYDSVGTYVITTLTVTNVAAASLSCWREYCDLDIVRGDYEEL